MRDYGLHFNNGIVVFQYVDTQVECIGGYQRNCNVVMGGGHQNLTALLSCLHATVHTIDGELW